MRIKPFKILDCTLRDGGYYTNWNFSDDFFDEYVSAVNSIGIDICELGYLSKAATSKSFRGKYFYFNVFCR